MEIEFLGVPLRNIENEIQGLLKQSDNVSIAVAYLKSSGIGKLEKSMRECLNNKGAISILTGFDFYLTEPEALRKLLQMNINCRIVFNENYHPKLYVFEKKDNVHIIIGSSNLSKGGLLTNYEANTLLIGNDKELPIKEAKDFFSHLWSIGVKLDEKIIELYEDERAKKPKIEFSEKGELSQYLSKILTANLSVDKLREKVNEGWENYEKGEMEEAYYNFKECIDSFNKLLTEHGEQDEFLEGKVKALIGLGHVNFQLNKLQEARNLSIEAEEISDKKESLILNLLSALTLGSLTYYDFDKEISYRKIKKFFGIYDELKKQNTEEIDEAIGFSDLAISYSILAEYNFNAGKKENEYVNIYNSIKYCEYDLKSIESDSFGAVIVYNKLGINYQLKWQIMKEPEPEPKESIENFYNALDLAKKLNAKFWEALVRRNLANVVKYGEHGSEACHHLKEAKKIYESLGHLELVKETDETIREICRK